MQIARLYDGLDPSGEPIFAPDRARITDAEERARLAHFLGSGRIIRRTTGLDIDRIQPARGRVVPMSTHTDGIWIWNAGLRYYLMEHSIAPAEDAFLTHIVNRGYRAATPDDATCHEALNTLRAAQGQNPEH